MTDLIAREGLVGLAERCEKASGPDREIDCLIWCSVHGIEPRWVGVRAELLDAGKEGLIGWIDPGTTARNFSTNRSPTGPNSIPAYTASLDAAMAIVPEGRQSDALHAAWSSVSKGHALHIRRWKNDADGDYGMAIARSVVAYALRARAAEMTHE